MWLIPSDARPIDPTSADVVPVSGPAPGVVAAPMGERFWWSLSELVDLFAPHVSRYALEQMLQAGEIAGYRRGSNGGWIVPTCELRRLMGA